MEQNKGSTLKLKNLIVLIGLFHKHQWVFGIVIGYLPDIPAYGLVLNLGAGGIIIGYKIIVTD